MSWLDVILDGLGAAWRQVQDSFTDDPVDSPVTVCPLSNPDCKVVSAKAKNRLDAAREAIAYAKEKLPYGAGNQMTALETTNYNSFHRMEVARGGSDVFDISPAVEDLESKNPYALLAAKAELAQGGNCGEHAWVVYDYLRRKYPGEHIQVAQRRGFDHAFVLIGDPTQEGASEVVVADAWPTKPTPVLWEDHFVYDRPGDLLNHASSQGDARDYKQEMLDAGLALNAEGQTRVTQSRSPEGTRAGISEARDQNRLWTDEYTANPLHRYDYVLEGAGSGQP